MARYDFRCAQCGYSGERTCLMADRASQTCRCGAVLQPLFSPPHTFMVPQAFAYAYSDLFGTSSEKDYLKANPNLERINRSTFVPAVERRRRKMEKVDREVASIEHAMRANRTLTDPTRLPRRAVATQE